ncbi:MAG: hypothetical protein SGPRY_007471, partial [Prymnesium sp.]
MARPQPPPLIDWTTWNGLFPFASAMEAAVQAPAPPDAQAAASERDDDDVFAGLDLMNLEGGA